MIEETKYTKEEHSAAYTEDYVFNQLIPYIGNKRKLLELIGSSIQSAQIDPKKSIFLDAFAGSGVVSRMAKKAGFSVISNDWEPYSEVINHAYIQTDTPPLFWGQSYSDTIAELNQLPPVEDWVSKHLCPQNDTHYNTEKERMFYMRKNGMRIDAIRQKIAEWEEEGRLDLTQKCLLLAPLLFQSCYNSNTSGVFKGFHNGWGGQTKTALYRIMGDLILKPITLYNNGRRNFATRQDAQEIVKGFNGKGFDFVYLDPPYNQHPYGSNYHVLNSVALWDKPELTRQIEGRNKSAIRMDWRTERRSKFNYKNEATSEYETLLENTNSRWIATSYSTDGMIPLKEMIKINVNLGNTRVLMKEYKRYRVSSQRFSDKPVNIEFILLNQIGEPSEESVSSLYDKIMHAESHALRRHVETSSQKQTQLFAEGI